MKTNIVRFAAFFVTASILLFAFALGQLSLLAVLIAFALLRVAVSRSGEIFSSELRVDIPIRMPFLERRLQTNLQVSKAVRSNLGFSFNARAFVKHGGGSVADGVTSNGSPTVTSATAGFVLGDVGTPISGTNIPANSYIGVINSATSVGLSSSATSNVPVNATGSGSGITFTFTGRIGIQRCATGDTSVYGWCPDQSYAEIYTPSVSDPLPPVALYGLKHWPFDPDKCYFVVNITDNSGHVGQANSAPQLSAVTIGSSYGLYTDTTTGMQMLNKDDTSNKFFKVINYYNMGAPNPSMAGFGAAQLTDYNGLVLVQLDPTVTIQS